MRQKLILFTLLILSVNVFATQQTPDLLIIGKDTIFLADFPLKQLELKHKPFGENEWVSTNCWRGYVAIWRIVDDTLFLEKIIRCNRESGEENIVELFKKNNIQYQEKNGMIFANWCTLKFYKVTVYTQGHSVTVKELQSNGWEKQEKKLVLQIENGIVTRNEL